MRSVLLLLSTGALFGQQPILYYREAVNAASYAPFGLPNAPIARGSLFTVFGENLGPAKSPGLTFPLSQTLGGVSISVTQNGVVTQTFPIFVGPTQINAVMPSTVKAGLATLRLTYQSQKSNAITIQIADSAPGVLAVSGGGYGPGIVQNFISESNDQLNSLVAPAGDDHHRRATCKEPVFGTRSVLFRARSNCCDASRQCPARMLGPGVD